MCMELFDKNSRVTFLGDSITAANSYTARIFDYYLKYHHEHQVKFFCAGIGGANISTGLDYLEDDVLSTKPDVVPIMYGVNDSCRELLDGKDNVENQTGLEHAYQVFQNRYNVLIDRLMAHHIKVILCTPAPYAEYYMTSEKPLEGGYTLIFRYAEYVRKLAKERNLPLIDYHAWLSERYLCEQIYTDDHVHLNELGYARMAECFLAAQGVEIREWKPNAVPEPYSDKITEWRSAVFQLRHLLNTEYVIVRNNSLSPEEKMNVIKKYAMDDKNDSGWREAANYYINNKSKETEYRKIINNLTDSIYDMSE